MHSVMANRPQGRTRRANQHAHVKGEAEQWYCEAAYRPSDCSCAHWQHNQMQSHRQQPDSSSENEKNDDALSIQLVNKEMNANNSN